MRSLLRPAARLGLVFSLLCLWADRVPAQQLHGRWFKVSANSPGVSLQDGGASATPVRQKIVNYVRLVTKSTTATSVTYELQLFAQNDVGAWVVVFPVNAQMTLAAGETIITQGTAPFYAAGGLPPAGGGPGGIGVATSFNGRMVVHRDAAGAIVSARFRSLGGVVSNGSADGQNSFLGGLKLRGVMVAPSDLPFGG